MASSAAGKAPAPPSLRLRCVSFNIWTPPVVAPYVSARMHAVCDELARLDYDIIGIQELFTPDARHIVLQRLHAMGYFVTTFAAGAGLPGAATGSGLVVASRFPVLDSVFVPMTNSSRPLRFDHFDWSVGKGIGMCRILLPDAFGTCDVFVSHLQAHYSHDDVYEHLRALQAVEAGSFIRATRRSDLTLLFADLNATPSSLTYRTLCTMAGLRDAYSCCTVDGAAGQGAVPGGRARSNTEARSINVPTFGVPDNVFGRSAKGTHEESTRLDYILFGTGTSPNDVSSSPFSVDLLHKVWHVADSTVQMTRRIVVGPGLAQERAAKDASSSRGRTPSADFLFFDDEAGVPVRDAASLPKGTKVVNLSDHYAIEATFECTVIRGPDLEALAADAAAASSSGQSSTSSEGGSFSGRGEEEPPSIGLAATDEESEQEEGTEGQRELPDTLHIVGGAGSAAGNSGAGGSASSAASARSSGTAGGSPAPSVRAYAGPIHSAILATQSARGEEGPGSAGGRSGGDTPGSFSRSGECTPGRLGGGGGGSGRGRERAPTADDIAGALLAATGSSSTAGGGGGSKGLGQLPSPARLGRGSASSSSLAGAGGLRRVDTETLLQKAMEGLGVPSNRLAPFAPKAGPAAVGALVSQTEGGNAGGTSSAAGLRRRRGRAGLQGAVSPPPPSDLYNEDDDRSSGSETPGSDVSSPYAGESTKRGGEDSVMLRLTSRAVSRWAKTVLPLWLKLAGSGGDRSSRSTGDGSGGRPSLQTDDALPAGAAPATGWQTAPPTPSFIDPSLGAVTSPVGSSAAGFGAGKTPSTASSSSSGKMGLPSRGSQHHFYHHLHPSHPEAAPHHDPGSGIRPDHDYASPEAWVPVLKEAEAFMKRGLKAGKRYQRTLAHLAAYFFAAAVAALLCSAWLAREQVLQSGSRNEAQSAATAVALGSATGVLGLAATAYGYHAMVATVARVKMFALVLSCAAVTLTILYYGACAYGSPVVASALGVGLAGAGVVAYFIGYFFAPIETCAYARAAQSLKTLIHHDTSAGLISSASR